MHTTFKITIISNSSAVLTIAGVIYFRDDLNDFLFLQQKVSKTCYAYKLYSVLYYIHNLEELFVKCIVIYLLTRKIYFKPKDFFRLLLIKQTIPLKYLRCHTTL